MGNIGIVGKSMVPGVVTVETALAILVILATLAVLASSWGPSAVLRWRAGMGRSTGWWWRVGRRLRRRIGRQVGDAVARQLARLPLLRAALAAHALLRHLLSPAEHRQLRRMQCLEVPSRGHPGRVYRVPRGGGLVEVVKGGQVVERLCVAPSEQLPRSEVVLVHKLLIEADEEGYLALANHLPAGITWRPAARAALGPWGAWQDVGSGQEGAWRDSPPAVGDGSSASRGEHVG